MEERIQYYHILTIDNEELLDMLDYWDRAEQKLIRQSWDNRSFSQQNYEKAFDEEGNSLDPMDLEVFKEWSNAEDCAGGKKLPVKAEHVIVHSIIERLSPIDQRVFQYMFDIHMTEAEIKQAFELSDSAWTEEKKRFLGKVRRVFIKLGYDVPSLDDVQSKTKDVVLL